MPNKALFSTIHYPETQDVNRAGGLSYQFEAEHALCQLVCTGTFN